MHGDTIKPQLFPGKMPSGSEEEDRGGWPTCGRVPTALTADQRASHICTEAKASQ